MLVVAISSLFKMSLLWWLTLLMMGICILGGEALAQVSRRGIWDKSYWQAEKTRSRQRFYREAESLSISVTILHVWFIHAYQPLHGPEPSYANHQRVHWANKKPGPDPAPTASVGCAEGGQECSGRVWSNRRGLILFTSFMRKGMASQQQLWQDSTAYKTVWLMRLFEKGRFMYIF